MELKKGIELERSTANPEGLLAVPCLYGLAECSLQASVIPHSLWIGSHTRVHTSGRHA